MFKLNLKIFLKSILKNKVYFVVNVLGLAIGVACATLIFLWVQFELSYDRDLKYADRIFRVNSKINMSGHDFSSSMAPPPLAEAFDRGLPEVEASTRIWNWANISMSYDDGKTQKIFNEKRVFEADSNFFYFFHYKLKQGKAETVLNKPWTVVLSEKAALRYFTKSEVESGEVINKRMKLTLGGYGIECRVTGIAEDTPPNTHFHFDILLSSLSDPWSKSQTWTDNTYYTYILLRQGTDPKAVEKKIPLLVKPFLDPQLRSNYSTSYDELKANGNYWDYYLQPVTDIHLYSNYEREIEPNGSIRSIYILSIVAVFILLIACINYVNISTAKAKERSKEVGVKVTLGSGKKLLQLQFFTESFIITLISFIVASVLVYFVSGYFNSVMGIDADISIIRSGFSILLFLLLFVLVVLLGGLYPGLYLSSLIPVEALKGKVKSRHNTIKLRNILVITQFTVSTGLIISAILVYQQLRLLREKSPGFHKENIVVVEDPSMRIGGKAQEFIDELYKNTNVISANVATDYPGSGNYLLPIVASKKGESSDHILTNFKVGYDFLKTFDIQLADGRGFMKELDSINVKRVILNEAAARELGLKNPVNDRIITKNLSGLTVNQAEYEIIGIVKDFNFESFHKKIRPVALFLTGDGELFNVRVSGDISSALGVIDNTWRKFAPEAPLEYTFVDDQINALYTAEIGLSKVLTVLTILTIVIACSGLYGLTLFIMERRTKEIGIRKIHGASVTEITFVLCKDFIKWILIAFVIACPVTYFAMNRWLENFAYRTTISWWLFLLTAGITLAIALITISYHTLKAARGNPLKAVRVE
ncbi:ABC transporter permease [Ohtaekwangia sp.]|uniref:ABC transporter permease n=1 Tax=Ohtaekwangia sp. TaxID=2066019 RepID=UPI002FDD2127